MKLDALKPIPRRYRKLVLRELGYSSVREFAINRKTQPGTPMRIVAWLETLSGVRHARIARGSVGTVFVLICMRWWAWLTLGWLHRRALRQANAVVQREKPAAADFTVGFEP